MMQTPWLPLPSPSLPNENSHRRRQAVFKHCESLNEPAQWTLDEDRLHVTTDGKTDFWRRTHYGFIRDSGHCFGTRTNGDFSAQVHIRGGFESLSDQARLMARIHRRHWGKPRGGFPRVAFLVVN